MDTDPTNPKTWQGLLGYLNFSTGRPDARIRGQFFELWQTVADAASPRLAIYERLQHGLAALQSEGLAPFKDATQAEAVLDLAFRHVPAAYRRHHADLLADFSDAELFPPGILVRAVEAVLSQQGPWDEGDRIIAGVLRQLNEYVGHRPIAVLESRLRGEPYDHERVCTVPLYFRGTGVAPGKYAALVKASLGLIQASSSELLAEAYFDFDHLDELAYDPRAYDHNHPADKRPNYRFGEWDPHHIDNRGFYRRMVVRQGVLEGLLQRVNATKDHPAEELLQEAAAVMAGTMLMASGISGAGPETHDSSVNLGTLMPRIARYRDAFYDAQLASLGGTHGDRLRQEAITLRQAFGSARQHINQYLAQQRAAQLQQRRLALLIAELGYPDAARRHAGRVRSASIRLLAEIHIHLTASQALAERGKHGEAVDQIAEAEGVLHRAIACGAAVDPWNILGFQGLYPLFHAREDSAVDHRIGEMVQVVARMLGLYARLRSDAAAVGDEALGVRLATQMEKLSKWWDRFATTTVNDIPHVLAQDATASAEHVAEVLRTWRQRGEAAGDLAFWRQHLERFRTSKSFALVIEELLRKHDFRSSMALLMNWLAQADKVALQDGEHSFHVLALRWMLTIVKGKATTAGTQSAETAGADELVRKFIDYLEANAEDYWTVPRLEAAGQSPELSPAKEEDEETLYGAAYESVTYKDSADDGTEGELLGFEPRQEFELERETERLEERLRFQSTLARLFHVASRHLTQQKPDKQSSDSSPAKQAPRELLEGWLAQAARNYQDLLTLMEAIYQRPIPAPSGSYDSLVEFDRRNAVKQRLLTMVIGTCLDCALAVGGMQGLVGAASAEQKRPRWEPAMLGLEQALWKGDVASAKQLLPRFLEHFQHEPLLYTPLAQGGNPRLVLRTSIAQTLLRALAANLPRIGLLRETYALLRVAQTMEREQKLQGPRITEFDRLFQIACQASAEAIVESSRGEPNWNEAECVSLLGRLIDPYLRLWTEHSRTVRMGILEAVAAEDDWAKVRAFIRKHGAGLFHARFMTLANLRGILQGGVAAYIKHLEENPDPQNPISLVDDLDRATPRDQAEQHLQVVLQAVAENYEEYRDYNSTTTQSDYGENLHVLLDFLRLKAAYDRQAWLVRPLGLVHEVLAKYSSTAAALWQHQVERLTAQVAAQFLARLAELEKQHGVHLRTVADRVRERFVQPLVLDRVCALIEPAYDEARMSQTRNALSQLEQSLQPFVEAPGGAGMEVPGWLRRLEAELQRVRLRRTAVAHLAENLIHIPRLIVPVETLRTQLQDWPKP